MPERIIMGVNTESFSWTNGRGNKIVREVNMVIDVREYLGTPGYSMLLTAANTNLSVGDIDSVLNIVDRECPGVERSSSWIRRRRWLFQQPGTVNVNGPKPNEDGRQARALAIMDDNRTMSVRQLVHLLKRNGITRCREWVRKHRCDAAK